MALLDRRNGRWRKASAECHARRAGRAEPGARLLRTGIALALSVIVCAAAAAAPLDPEAESERAFAEAMQAIEASQWGQAELLLERTLMLNPEHAGARLELAGLLAARRRTDSARALIQSLIDDPRTPEPHRARLRAMLAQTAPADAAGRAPAPQTVEVSTEVFAGRVTNPLALADLRELTLTFPGGSVTLPVDLDPKPGNVIGASVRRTVPGSWSLDATVQRLTGGESGDAHRVGVSGYLPLPGLGAQTQVQWLAQTQRAFIGTDRHFVGLTVNSSAWGFAGGAFDEPDVGRHGAYLRVDRLTQPRPGLLAIAFLEGEHAVVGPPSFLRAGASIAWAPAPGWALYAQGDLVRDLAGYSPLLDNGARRETESLNLALERAWQPGTKSWQILARTFVGRRWSNLELFGYSDAGLQISLRKRW